MESQLQVQIKRITRASSVGWAEKPASNLKLYQKIDCELTY